MAVQPPFERLGAYLEQAQTAGALGHPELYEGMDVYAFGLPGGQQVRVHLHDGKPERFIVKLPSCGDRTIGQHTRVRAETAVELEAILDKADQAASAV